MIPPKKPILIIGAGVAGLYAGYLLKAQGYEVRLLEARDTYGGRIGDSKGWSDFPLELGAAYIHGEKQLFYELASFAQQNLSPVAYKPYYYYKGELLTATAAKEKKKLKKAASFFDRVYQYRGYEQSVEAFLSQKKYYQKTKNILTGLAYEYGTDLDQLGLLSLAIEEYNWHSGNKDFVSSTPFLELLEEFYQPLAKDIQYNTAVKAINFSTDTIQVTDQEHNEYFSQKVIVTVPLSVLKSQLIHFTPALPAAKMEAIQRLGFDVGMKVFMKFKTRFWPEGMTELYGGNHCPRYEDATMGHASEMPILCAYIMGKKALKLSSLPQDEVVNLLLNELDQIFENHQANQNFVDFKLQDWGKEPYIWGAYSFASPFSEGMREELAKPLRNRVFFAGEATNYIGHNSTVHGAMESAEIAVEKLLETFPTHPDTPSTPVNPDIEG